MRFVQFLFFKHALVCCLIDFNKSNDIHGGFYK